MLSLYWILYSHKKQRKCKSIAESGEGRNVTLFNILREWAYVRVKQHLIYEHYFKEVEEKALQINLNFNTSSNGLLPFKEVLTIANSVSKWTWKHRHSIGEGKRKGILDLPDNMDLKEKQILGAKYSHTARTEKVDNKIKNAIYNCKYKKIEPTRFNIIKNGLSESTYFKYKEAVENWIKLLS